MVLLKEKSGYTVEYLLTEAVRLMDRIAISTDTSEVCQLEACFSAIQEVLLARREAKNASVE